MIYSCYQYEEGGIAMVSTAVIVNDLLDTLEEEDINTAIRYIEFLSASRKQEKAKQSQALLEEIQGMFSNDKGWESEDAMLKDMAAFRRERLGL